MADKAPIKLGATLWGDGDIGLEKGGTQEFLAVGFTQLAEMGQIPAWMHFVRNRSVPSLVVSEKWVSS